MYHIHCRYCDDEIILDYIPDYCENCKCRCEDCLEIEMISSKKNENSFEEKQNIVEGITLIYQKTGEEIYIPKTDRIILGRESFGHEVLRKVKYISRIHCMIEYSNNQYMVTDLGSRNGTYLGVSRIDCKSNPKQVLKDGDILYLGKEMFLVKFVTRSNAGHELKKEVRQEELAEDLVEEVENIMILKYTCKLCGRMFDVKKDICPNCNAFGTMESVKV